MYAMGIRGAVTILTIATATTAVAAETGWLTERQLRQFVRTHMQGGKSYGTAISCKDGGNAPLLKLAHRPFSGEPPFYRWQFVFGERHDLSRIIGELRLEGEASRRYRIIQQDSYLASNGREMTCAIVYR